MRIGIIGTGSVGQNLATGFKKLGHDVVIGTRDPEKTLARTEPDAMGTPPVAEIVKEHSIPLQTMEEAAKHGEIVVLAVVGAAAHAAVSAAGPANLAGKLILDTTNPLHFTEEGIVKDPAIPSSVIEQVQRAAPKAHFVKVLNCVPGWLMANPKLERGTIFICGDDGTSKNQAIHVLGELGWEALDVGGSNLGPYLEGMGIIVVNYGVKADDWGWALKLLRAPAQTVEAH